MTLTDDRATVVLDRPVTAPQPTPGSDEVEVRQDLRTRPVDRPVPRGWGSHDERRTMRLALLGFVLLGLYAVGFVLLGQALST